LGDWSGDGATDIVYFCVGYADGGLESGTVHLIDGTSIGSLGSTRLLDLSLGSWLTTRDDTEEQNEMNEFLSALDLDGDALADFVIKNRTLDEEDRQKDRFFFQVSTDGIPGPYTPLSTRGHFLHSEVNKEKNLVSLYPAVADINGDGLGDLLLNLREAEPDSTSYYQRLEIVLGWDLPWHDPLYW
jgi:hypothetical protein